MRRVAPALGLFFLARFVGEFLLGNLTLGELGLGIILAPMYGAGALLIREVTRRTGRGWPTMALLATAYALMEEGPIDQLLWNDSYAGHDLLHGDSYIPAIGMSVELTLAVIALHAVWSVGGLGLFMIPRWSRQEGWGQSQVFALAAGATLTYAWVAFPTRPESGGSHAVDLIGNAVFGAVAVLVLLAGVRKLNPNQRSEWSASLR